MPLSPGDIVRRFISVVWNQGDMENGRDLFDPGFRHHDLVTHAESDLEGYLSSIGLIRESRSGVELLIRELIVEEERVASRWTAVDPGLEIHGMSVDHVRDGLIVENWTVWDRYGLSVQAPGLID